MSQTFGWKTIDLAEIPPLEPGEIHIYATLLPRDPAWEQHAIDILNAEETARASQFRFDDDRYRFQKTRVALRQLLAHYLSTDPRSIPFREGPHGKPFLDRPDDDLQFNVSHTRGASVLAFARGFEVGIDIEHSRRKVDVEGVGRKVFTPTEQVSLRDLGSASALREFFRLWTAKEAYLKATGSGLSCNPSTVQTDFEKNRFTPSSDPASPLPYVLQELATRNGFQICLAHQQQRKPPQLHLHEIE